MKVKVLINTDDRGKYFVHKRKKTYIKSRCLKLMPKKEKFNVYVKEDGIKYYNAGGRKVYIGKDKETSKLICDDLDKVVKSKRKKINKVLTTKLQELVDVKTKQKEGKQRKMREVAKIAKLKIDERKQKKKKEKEAKEASKRRSYAEVKASLEFLTDKRRSIKNEAGRQGWGAYQTQRAIREFDAFMANPNKPIETPALGLLYNKPSTFMRTDDKGLPTTIPDPTPEPTPTPVPYPPLPLPSGLAGVEDPTLVPIAKPLKIDELGNVVFGEEEEEPRLTINNKDFDEDEDFMMSEEEEEEELITSYQQMILDKIQAEGREPTEEELASLKTTPAEEEGKAIPTPTLAVPVAEEGAGEELATPPIAEAVDTPRPLEEPKPSRRGRGLAKPTPKKTQAIKDAKQQIQQKLLDIQRYMDSDIRSANNYNSHIEVLKEPLEAEQRAGVFIKDAVKKLRADAIKQYKTYTKQLILHFVQKYRKNPFKETTIAHYRIQGEVRRIEKSFGQSAPMNEAPQNIEDYDTLNTMIDYWKGNDNFRRKAVDSGIDLMDRKLDKFGNENDKTGLYEYSEELVKRFSVKDDDGNNVALLPTKIKVKMEKFKQGEGEDHFEAIFRKNKIKRVQAGFEFLPKYWKKSQMEHEVYETIAHNVRTNFTTTKPELFGDEVLTRAVFGDKLDEAVAQAPTGNKMSASAINLMTGDEDHQTAPTHAGVEVEGGHIPTAELEEAEVEAEFNELLGEEEKEEEEELPT